MTARRAILSLVAGTFGPPLAALQLLNIVDLTRTEYWLGIGVLTVTSFSSSGLTLLSTLVKGNVNIGGQQPPQ